MKKLIVRADDFGYSEGTSLGILAAHRDGIVTCTSVMINMPYAKEAIALAKQYPNLSLGIHINVTNGKALASHEKIPHLIDSNGVFLSSTKRRQQIKNKEEVFPQEEAYQEALAQIEKYIGIVGKLPDYIDVHVLEEEPFIKAILRAQETYQIPACPYGDASKAKLSKQSMGQYAFYKKEYNEFIEYFEEGHFTFDNPIEILVCHPGFIDYYITKNSSMIEERLLDFGLVTDEKIKQWLKDTTIQLVNFTNGKDSK